MFAEITSSLEISSNLCIAYPAGRRPNIMTNNEQLEQLLNDCIAKANAYINAVSERGQFNDYVTSFHKAWEDAEALYAARLAMTSPKTPSVDPAVSEM
jgi:hypothetical protein